MKPGQVKIREATNQDADSICLIASQSKELEAYQESGWYSPEQIEKWINGQKVIALVAESEGKVIGFALATFNSDKETGYLEEMAIDSRSRGKGIGKLLFNEVFNQLKGEGANYFYALVQEKNQGMVNFMEKHGFKKGYKFYWMDKSL